MKVLGIGLTYKSFMLFEYRKGYLTYVIDNTRLGQFNEGRGAI